MKSLTHTTLAVAALAALITGCNQATPPAPQTGVVPPETPASTIVSGTLPDWQEGAAFATLAGGLTFGLNIDDEEVSYHDVNALPPVYRGAVTANGSFRIELSDPDPSLLFPLGCTADGPDITGVGILVASKSAALADDEIVGIYANVDSKQFAKEGLWLYTDRTYAAKETCTASESGLQSIDLALTKGWNPVVASMGASGVILTSQKIPESFVWLDPFITEEGEIQSTAPRNLRATAQDEIMSEKTSPDKSFYLKTFWGTLERRY